MMRRHLACLTTCALVAGVALATRNVAAKPPKAAAASAGRGDAAAQLPPGTLDKLRSGDPGSIRGALDDVRTVGKAAQAAAGPIAALLDRGTTSELTVAALDTLGDVEAESSSKSIAWYAVHRNQAVRQAAVKALARTKGPAAVTALRHALSDGDAGVRGMAATGLGALKAKEAVRDLFVALDHRVSEAAASIGQLCAPTEIDDDEKVKIVGRLRELGTAEANRFLKDVQKRWTPTWSARVKQAIDQGVLATTVSQ